MNPLQHTLNRPRPLPNTFCRLYPALLSSHVAFRKEAGHQVAGSCCREVKHQRIVCQHAVDSGNPERETQNWAWVGPARYCSSWIFPLTALGAVHCQQLAAYLQTTPILCALSPYWTSLLLSYSGVLYTFLALPALDSILGRDISIPPKGAKCTIEYLFPLYVCVPLHLGMLASACMEAHHLVNHPAHFIGVSLSIACSGGLGFTAAHELLHGRTLWDKILSNLLLCPLFYMHWTLSHLCHHQKVGTYQDPATARYGESLYSFIPRSIIGNMFDGFQVEAKRIQSAGKRFVSINNRILLWVLSPTLLVAVVWMFCSVPGVLMLMSSSAGAIFLVESVNYIEHYGLKRAKCANGCNERVGPQHSWNADWAMTSAMTFQLQRHAHHHMDPAIPYQVRNCEHLVEISLSKPNSSHSERTHECVLCVTCQALVSNQVAPLLPASYPTMMLLSTCPPLFFKIMNPRVDDVNQSKSD